MNSGTGVELKISTDKAKQQIKELISNIQKLHNMFEKTMELKLKADTSEVEKAKQDVTNFETTVGNVNKTELKLKVDSKELEKVVQGLKETEEESKKAEQGLTRLERKLICQHIFVHFLRTYHKQYMHRQVLQYEHRTFILL